MKYGSSMLAIDVRDVYDRHAPLWLPTGVSPVRYVLQWGLFDVPNVLAVHCTQVDDADIEVLASRNVAVAHCPRCNAKLGMGIAPLNKMLARRHHGRARHRLAGGAATRPTCSRRCGSACCCSARCSAKQTFMIARQFVKMATLDAARALRHRRPGRLARAGQASPTSSPSTSPSPTRSPRTTRTARSSTPRTRRTCCGRWSAARWSTRPDGGPASITSAPSLAPKRCVRSCAHKLRSGAHDLGARVARCVLDTPVRCVSACYTTRAQRKTAGDLPASDRRIRPVSDQDFFFDEDEQPKPRRQGSQA